uniref:Ig-like domain-containing protein n=1 Tax=Seriola lalandi dorsalis TaxID=1841481 RepID=A0A3B4WTW1_SERLL
SGTKMGSPSKRVISTGLSVASELPLWKQYPPAFVTKPDPQTVYVGKRAMIQCVITGSAPLNVVWLKDNQDLPKYRIMSQGAVTSLEIHSFESKEILSDSDCLVTKDNISSSLELFFAKTSDSGDFMCEIQNDVGSTSCQASLFVKG